jgi:hypothetical protein
MRATVPQPSDETVACRRSPVRHRQVCVCFHACVFASARIFFAAARIHRGARVGAAAAAVGHGSGVGAGRGVARIRIVVATARSGREADRGGSGEDGRSRQPSARYLGRDGAGGSRCATERADDLFGANVSRASRARKEVIHARDAITPQTARSRAGGAP